MRQNARAASRSVVSLLLLASVMAGLGSEAIAAPRERGPKPATKSAPGAKTENSALEGLVFKRIIALLDALEQDGDFAAAETAATALFDQVAMYATDRDMAVIRETAFVLRLISQLNKVDAEIRPGLLKYCRANHDFAHTLVFLISPAADNLKGVYALASRLQQMRGPALERYASLAAAISVVHDKPLARQINENRAQAIDPLLIFDYFVENEKAMIFGLRDVPAELLVYVVDATANVEEMRWAKQRYAHDANVGARFFEIDYDYDSFLKGKPKKVTQAGFNLPNILQYGGVCADQAYFAMSVGKSIGVPTTYTVGRGAELSHAWVGFLQADRGRVWWNFDSGRYEAYQGVKGQVADPQSGKRIPDSYVSLLAELSTTPREARFNATALTDLARRLMVVEQPDPRRQAPSPSGPFEGAVAARSADTASELALLELALRQCAGYAPAWFTVRDLAAAGKLTLPDKKKWANVLHRLCADRYPDFYLEVLRPMIQTVDNANDQNSLWEAAFAAFSARADLAAEVRFEQGQMWEKAQRRDRGGKCYEDVLMRFANSGPFVLEALRRAEAILVETGRADLTPTLYQDTWARVKKPQDSSAIFFRQSNWYRIGKACIDRMRKAGQDNDARAAQMVLDSEEQRRAPSGTR